MGGVGWQELLIVLLIVLVVFGAGRLPQIGEGLGKGIRNLKRSLKSDDDIEVTAKEKQVTSSSGARTLKETLDKEEVSEAEVVER